MNNKTSKFILVSLVIVAVLGVGYTLMKRGGSEVGVDKSTAVWKVFDPETAYGAGSNFDVKYPADWHEIQLRERGALAFHEWPTDSDSCLISLGAGGHGVGEGDSSVSAETSSKMYGNLEATKQIFKQSGQILLETTSFSRDNIPYIFELYTKKEADYSKCKQDYEDILATFRFK